MTGWNNFKDDKKAERELNAHRLHSYHRTRDRAEQVAQQINGEVITGKHPDPEYRGLTVWWVVR